MASRALPFITATCGLLAGLAIGVAVGSSQRAPAEPPPVIVHTSEVDLQPILDAIEGLHADVDALADRPAPTARPSPVPRPAPVEDTATPIDTGTRPEPVTAPARGDTLQLRVGERTTLPIPAGVRFITSNDAIVQMTSTSDREVAVMAVGAGTTAIVLGLADGSFSDIPVEVR